MKLRVDVIVIGAGTAGLPCAIEAAQAGARVLLIDKADDFGGTLHISGGHLSAAGSRRQQRRGIEDRPSAHHDDIRRISRGTAREDLVSTVVARAADTIDWLDDHGFDFADDCPRIVYGHEPYRVARTVYGRDEARSILAVLRRLIEPVIESGAVELWLGARVTALRCDDEGRVRGVVAERGGDALAAEAPAVVLATGGYGASADWVRELDNRPLVSAAAETSTGDGLGLIQAVGGAIVHRGQSLPTFGGLPSPTDPGRAQWRDRPLLVATERRPWEIYVDRRGQRFVAEDEESMHAKEEALAELPDLTFFTIFDRRAVETSPDIVVGWSAERLRREASRRDGVTMAPTLPELARRAGIDPAGLAATVARYNAALIAGEPDPLGRTVRPAPIEKPPFFALRNHGITLITFAGVDVDDRLRVRREDGTVVAGLYAAGEVLGAAATTGRAFCGGMMLTPALVFGRWLGQRLAGGEAGS